MSDIRTETDLAKLEEAFDATEQEIDVLRGIERNQDRGSDWNARWTKVWNERKTLARRIARLTPTSADDSIAHAIAALRVAAEARRGSSVHGGGVVQIEREAVALDQVADVLENADHSELLSLYFAALRARKAKLAEDLATLEAIR